MALLVWGDYTFEVGGASFDRLKHRFGGRWAREPVFGRRPPGQYLSPGPEFVSLEGVIYTVVAGIGAYRQIVALLGEAGAGTVDFLFTGDGDVVGLFRLDEGEYSKEGLLPDGTPLKVTFSLKFSAADDNDGTIFAVWP
ncbi:phage tail protein [Rhodoblastus sp.]|uniref:phage tail protein n=1 Tax=Rhodoblastus sp. TaxID=1962975 RepID=UPI003F960A1D